MSYMGDTAPAGYMEKELGYMDGLGYMKPQLGNNIILNGYFANWSGDDPDNWNLSFVEDANNYVTEVSGACRLTSDTLGKNINQNVAEVGKAYRLNIDVNTVYAGGIKLVSGSSTIVIYTIPGSKTIDFVASGTQIAIQNSVAISDVEFDNMSIRKIL